MYKTIIRIASGILLVISLILFIIFWNKIYNGATETINDITGNSFMLVLWSGILLFISQFIRLFEIKENHHHER